MTKQEAHGPHRSPEKQFKSINPDDYIITWLKGRKTTLSNFWDMKGFFIWTNLNPLHPRMLFAKFGWNWHSCSREEDSEIMSMYFHYFVIISPWKRGGGASLEKNLNSLHHRMLYAKFAWNWPSSSGKENENVKSLRQQRQRKLRLTTNKLWSEKLTRAFSSGELKTRIFTHFT